MNGIAVVIPIYRDDLSLTEQISLKQAQRILGKYPLCFMAPKHLKKFFKEYDYPVEYFPDEDMSSRTAYSKLLLTPEFYQRFCMYKYILIYQLDAFVFSDQLPYFCSLDYDYIGAPMSWRWLSIPHIFCRVGNGGFSLRKIESCIRITSMRESIYQNTGLQNVFEELEDKFFGYCGKVPKVDFFVPPLLIVSRFSLEFDMAHAWEKVSTENLPFGCHAWSKAQNFDFWRPYIEPFVGKALMDQAEKEVFGHGRRMRCGEGYLNSIYPYLVQRVLRRAVRREIHDVLSSAALHGRPCILWGNGIIGQRIRNLLAFADAPLSYIFDKSAVYASRIDEIPFLPVDDKILCEKTHIVIVATSKYYGEIAAYLSELGLIEGTDFISYHVLEKTLVEHYYGKLGARYRNILARREGQA